MNRLGSVATITAVVFACSGCALLGLGIGSAGGSVVPTPVSSAVAAVTPGPGAAIAASTTPSVISVAVVGDMDCRILCPRSPDVAALVGTLHPDAFLPPGDLLNNTSDWSVYEADWGGLKSVTYPVPGNHEYTAGIDAYDQYWGSAAHAPDHYYSFDLGSWHVVALNGELDTARGSAQEMWFAADLADHPAACTVVLIHGPRWSSSLDHPSDDTMQALWDDSVGAHVDLWLSGHAHLYERFGPLDSDGLPYDEGTTEFVIGTGGRQLHRFSREALPGEIVRDNDTYGTGLFTLGDGAWSMEFVPIPGQTFRDAASGTCH